MMELGNLLFGHSRGEYAIDRDSAAAFMLTSMLIELGVDSYGRIQNEDRTRLTPVLDCVLVETLRGVDIQDPDTGQLLMRVRSYWWGDGEDPEANLPNLEVPLLGLEVRWYKYWSRDAYTNQPFTRALMLDVRRIVQPALDAVAPYAKHPVDTPISVIEYATDRPLIDFNGQQIRPMYAITVDCPVDLWEWDHGYIILDDGRFTALLETRDETIRTSSRFSSIDLAVAWCKRQMTRFQYGKDTQ